MAKDVTEQTFESEVLNSDKPVVVDFWAPWCGPCRVLSPVVEKLSQSMQDVKFVKVNIDENTDLAADYRVQSIPFLLMFKNGKPAVSRVGSSSLEALESWVKENK